MLKPNTQLEMPINCGGNVPSRAAAAVAPPRPAWAQKMLSAAGIAQDAEEWIGTREAARILGAKNIRTVQRYCDDGRLKPVQDWRKIPGVGGDDRGGNYRIRKAAVQALAAAAG